jgi:serine O-acetyltransferase
MGGTKSFAKRLFEQKKDNKTLGISRRDANEFLNDLFELIFPNTSSNHLYLEDDFIIEINRIKLLLQKCLKTSPKQKERELLTNKFFTRLENIYDQLQLDANAILEGDPAAESLNEVIFSYPGFFAIYTYRIANFFYKEKTTLFPRMLSEYAHQLTGIDIHPGATIGKSFVIDHGTGIVIGETTTIGNHVKIYQGVTLGALSVDKSMASNKRHPTIGDNSVIYSNATLLGGDTIIGKNCIVGGNVWITKSIPDNSICYHKSEMKMLKNKKKRESAKEIS